MALRIQNGSGRHVSPATKINFASSSTLPVSSSEPSEISKDSHGNVSSSLPREVKPLKGILLNQGFRSQDSSPSSSPRAVPDCVSVDTASVSQPSGAKKADQPAPQKRGMTSSAVADFLKKFSPKLTRSKKSLQWYTVDIQPSGGAAALLTSRNCELESDPTVRELQNGRISSEFSLEMSECLSKKNLDDKCRSLPVGVSSVTSSAPQSARSLTSRTAQDRTDFLQSGFLSARNGRTLNGDSSPSSTPVSKSMPATPVAQNHHQTSSQEWRMMMVDIDVDRTDKHLSGSQQKRADYLGDLTTGLRNHSLVSISAPASADRRENGHVPSYIRLSRALNGYSARNMYSSKKLMSSRDYNVMLCRSEEFLHRPGSRTGLFDGREDSPARAPPLTAKELRSQPTRDDIRRAASEGRDLSGISAVSIEIPDRLLSSPVAKSPDKTDLSERAGPAFLHKLETEMEILRQLCRKGQQDLDNEQGDMQEDEKDNLRAAVGKTNLLLAQKCAQFAELCKKNINELPGDALKTTSSDLEGFWDLLCIQIKKCQQTFEEFYRSVDSSSTQDSPDAIPKSKPGKVDSRSGSRRSSATETPAGGRRSSKPKVSFQLTEKDLQRKEMIAAKRREFEQQQNIANKLSEIISAEPEVHFFVPAASVN